MRHSSGPEKERLEARTRFCCSSNKKGEQLQSQQLTSTQRGEAIRGGRATMMHAGPVHYYCCRRRILDPRPAPNCQLRDSRENHQGPTWARWARCMALGHRRDGRPGCQGARERWRRRGVEGVVSRDNARRHLGRPGSTP